MASRASMTWAASLVLSALAACSDDADPQAEAGGSGAQAAGGRGAMAGSASEKKAVMDAHPSATRRAGPGWDAIPEVMRPENVMPELQKLALAPNTDNGGMALFTDVVKVEPGADVMFCTYTSFIAKEKLYVHDSKAVQTRFGHHAILQYTLTPQEPGTHECPAGGLEQQQNQVLGGMGEGQNVMYPPNVVSEIPAGAQLMINHHWVNASDEPIEAQAEIVTVSPADDVGELVVARTFVVQSTSFKVPSHGTGEESVTCKLDRDVQFISTLGHMHEWGAHIKAERLGPEPAVILDHDFDPVQAIHPMVQYYPLDKPYSMKAGDSVRVSCNWNNTEEKPLEFPGEMCVLSAWQIGAERDTLCFDGKWVTL